MKLKTRLSPATWTTEIKESEIRRLLRYNLKYYFAGGLPGAIPSEILTTIMKTIIDEVCKINDPLSNCSIFNYRSSEGTPKLREILTTRMRSRENIPISDPNEVTITTGSQQALYGIIQTLINPQDFILISDPSYIGFLGPSAIFKARMVSIISDHNGIIPEELDKTCKAIFERFGVVPKLLYIQPDFENPTGLSLSIKRRKQIFDVAKNWGFYIIEDTPYKEISFDGRINIAIKSFDKENDTVFYLRSSSKETAALRIGYSVIPAPIRDYFVTLKGYLDLNTSALTQEIAYHYYNSYIDKIIPDIVAVYQERAGVMKNVIDEYLPGIRTDPHGGFFIWHTFNKNLNTTLLLKKSMKKGVIYVPGNTFHNNNGYEMKNGSLQEIGHINYNSIRLSYSNKPPNIIEEGIKLLSEIIT